MPGFPFDATITIGPHHLAAAGLDPGQRLDAIIEAVRRAVQRMEGADWIDVAAASFPPTCPGWVTLYPPGSSATPDTPSWQERRHQVEEAVKAALAAVDVER